MKIFTAAFIQVAMVAANTVFISKGHIAGMIFCSFGINWIWSHNVRKTAFGSESDRIWYAAGATTGCLTGFFATKLIL